MSEGRFKEEQSRINCVRMEDVVGGAAEKSFVRKVDCQCVEDSWHYSCPGIFCADAPSFPLGLDGGREGGTGDSGGQDFCPGQVLRSRGNLLLTS